LHFNEARDYVAATLNAWNSCHGIVKKQLDKQQQEIYELSQKCKEYELRLSMKKNDEDKSNNAVIKAELMKHKEKIENIYKTKLEDEKRKILKQRVDEIDRLLNENKRLNAKIAAKW
jgi:hypothetical protein